MKHHGVFASQVQAFKCACLLMHSSTAMMWTQSCSPTYDLRTRHLQYATAYHIMVFFIMYHIITRILYICWTIQYYVVLLYLYIWSIFFMYCLSRQQKSRWTQAGNSEAVGLILGVRRPRENRSSSHGESTDPPIRSGCKDDFTFPYLVAFGCFIDYSGDELSAYLSFLAPVISMTRAGKDGFCASP